MNLASLLNIPQKFKALLIGSVVLVVATLGAYAYGRHEGSQAEKLHAAKATTKEIVKYETKLQQQRVEVKVRDIAREQQLAKQLDSARAERDRLQGILNAKPDPDPTVYLRIGDVRLLNSAAKYPAASGVSDPASVASYQEQTPSTVGLRSFVGTELDIRNQYGQLATRCDALIDWVNVELIKAQTGQAKK